MSHLNGQLRNAANNGDAERASALLAQGADPNGVGAGNTALLLAVTNGHVAVTELLVGAGADPCASTQGRMPPLAQAIRLGRLDLAAVMLRTARRGCVARCLDVALSWAIVGRNCEAIELLASHGTDLSARSGSARRSPLDVARCWRDEAHPDVKPEFERVIDLLIRLGAA